MDEAHGRAIRVQLDVEDYRAAQLLHSQWTRKRFLAFLGIALLGALLMALRQEWSLIVGGGLLGGVLGGAVGAEIVRRLVLPRRSRRVFAQQKNLQRPVTMHWDSEELRWSSADGSGKTCWVDFVKWRRNDRVLLLYHSDLLFQLLPMRAFTSEELWASFETELARIKSA